MGPPDPSRAPRTRAEVARGARAAPGEPAERGAHYSPAPRLLAPRSGTGSSRVLAALPAAVRPRVHPPRCGEPGRGSAPCALPRELASRTRGLPCCAAGNRMRSQRQGCRVDPRGEGRAHRLGALAPSARRSPGEPGPGLERGRGGRDRACEPAARPSPARPGGAPTAGAAHRVFTAAARQSAPGSAAEPGLRRQNRLQLCISGLFFFFFLSFFFF